MPHQGRRRPSVRRSTRRERQANRRRPPPRGGTTTQQSRVDTRGPPNRSVANSNDPRFNFRTGRREGEEEFDDPTTITSSGQGLQQQFSQLGRSPLLENLENRRQQVQETQAGPTTREQITRGVETVGRFFGATQFVEGLQGRDRETGRELSTREQVGRLGAGLGILGLNLLGGKALQSVFKSAGLQGLNPTFRTQQAQRLAVIGAEQNRMVAFTQQQIKAQAKFSGRAEGIMSNVFATTTRNIGKSKVTVTSGQRVAGNAKTAGLLRNMMSSKFALVGGATALLTTAFVNLQQGAEAPESISIIVRDMRNEAKFSKNPELMAEALRIHEEGGIILRGEKEVFGLQLGNFPLIGGIIRKQQANILGYEAGTIILREQATSLAMEEQGLIPASEDEWTIGESIKYQLIKQDLALELEEVKQQNRLTIQAREDLRTERINQLAIARQEEREESEIRLIDERLRAEIRALVLQQEYFKERQKLIEEQQKRNVESWIAYLKLKAKLALESSRSNLNFGRGLF